MTMLINSERYDDALAMMKAQLTKTPNKPGLSQGIVSTLAKAGRLDEAYDWALKQSGPPDPVLFYSIGVSCWDKAYYDPMLDSTARGKIVDTGLAATKKALDIKSDYSERWWLLQPALPREAKLEVDPAKANSTSRRPSSGRTRRSRCAAAEEQRRSGRRRSASSSPDRRGF